MTTNLSLGQSSALVTHKVKTRYDMTFVRVREDGTSESTDGKMWLRVIPKECTPGVAFLVDGKAMAKAHRERAKSTRKKDAPPVVADPIKGTLGYVDKKGIDVTLHDVVTQDVHKFPPAQDVETEAKGDPLAHAYLGIDLAQKMLSAMKKAGADSVRVDFMGTGRKALRLKCITETDVMVGMLMPQVEPDKSNPLHLAHRP